MFNFIKNQLQKIYTHFSRIATIFSKPSIDQATLNELEQLLIEADTGVATTRFILEQLKKNIGTQSISGTDLKDLLSQELLKLLKPFTFPQENKIIYLLIGINGSGKTTFAGKLAHSAVSHHKKTILVAADTFRAAAPEQLSAWATKSGASLIVGNPNQDPASVVFAGCQQFKNENADYLIIDTAGRLQTKINLMNELAKIKRSIIKQLPDYTIITLLTIDGMLGQNSFQQAKLFNEATKIDAIALTKMDGTGKGGIVFAINHELNIPVAYFSYGEAIDQLKLFNCEEYVQSILNQ